MKLFKDNVLPNISRYILSNNIFFIILKSFEYIVILLENVR